MFESVWSSAMVAPVMDTSPVLRFPICVIENTMKDEDNIRSATSTITRRVWVSI